jgi:ubiquinone/menaquinone biosynthesis C-methylase UbiE
MAEFHLGKSKKSYQAIQALPNLFFGLFYNQLARSYDWVTTIISMGLWNVWLTEMLSYLEGPRVLELGSGPGHLHKILCENEFKSFSLEKSHQMVSLGRYRLLKDNFTPLLIRSVVEAIPYQDSVFDQVVTTFPAEFITRPQTLYEIKRVLKENGELVILRFAWLSDNHWPYKMAAWLFRLVGEAPGSNQKLPMDRLSDPFKKAGFTVDIQQINLPSSGMLILRCTKNHTEMVM